MRVLDKRTVLTCFGMTTSIILVGVACGCAKDVNPPVIQQSQMPEWAVEDEVMHLSVKTTDDREVKEVYVQFDSGEKISLAKTNSQKNGEELTNWEASFKLSPQEYSYSIIAEDEASNKSNPKEGKIAVYSKDSLYGYAQGKGIDNYLSQLSILEENGAVSEQGKEFIDLVAKYPEAAELVSGIYAEILKLPDLMTLDEKDIEAAEDMLMLASDPEYEDAFELMLSEGVPDTRKYCSPLEALLWIAYDEEFNNPADNPLNHYSVDKLIKDSWRNTTVSQRYSTKRWQDFEEVVDRLNSPQLTATYCIDNFPYDWTKWNAFIATGRGQGIWSPLKTFTEKKGACMDQSTFVSYCLSHGGYSNYNFIANKDNGSCLFSAGTRDNPLIHFTCLYTEGGNIYVIDVGTFLVRGIKGPCNTLEEAADITWTGWESYHLFCAGKTVTR